MGRYLNPGNAAFQESLNSKIYVDKSGLIAHCNELIQTQQKYMCISRPRRFGKTMAADMLTAYYSEGCDSSSQFDNLSVSSCATYHKHMNMYPVIHLNIQTFLNESGFASDMIERVKGGLLHDLLRYYGDIDYIDKNSLADVMTDIFAETGKPFIMIIDEWDCIFREYQSDSYAQRAYLDFLRNLLKDRTYIGLCYMTGILPIKKYGTQSALNMFTEYTMENPFDLAEFTGFTESEVKKLCEKYNIDFYECQTWYDGYSYPECGSIYNPKSVITLLLTGVFDDYWSRTETYESLRIYIDMNFDSLKDDILALIAGDKRKIATGSFQNDMTSLGTKDEVMTLLIHLGYLGYERNTCEVFIPNEEIRREFILATTSENSWSEIVNSVKKSDELLQSLLGGDEEEVAKGIEDAHFETSHLQYNDENALTYTISLALYSARRYYKLIRELPAGKGFADIAFIPRKIYGNMPAMIVELKWNKTAETAINQICERHYPASLKDYAGNILLIGINYDKETKKHTCRIEKA